MVPPEPTSSGTTTSPGSDASTASGVVAGGDTATKPGGSVSIETSHPPDDAASRRARRWRLLIEVVSVIVVAVVVAVLLRTFVVQTYIVPTGSMMPTIDPGDRIVVDKLSYHFHSIHTGDIIVFATPPAERDQCAPPPVPDLVKRVIGLPGQQISSEGNTVYINGKPLTEPWLPPNESMGPKGIKAQTIPAGEYFVMGDNRPDSCDSRYWGDVKRSEIVGKVVAIFWPLSRLHWF